MQLYSHQGALFAPVNDAFDINGFQELGEPLKIGLLEGGPKIHEENFAGHEVTFRFVEIQTFFSNFFK